MNKHEPYELAQMQSLPLNSKIRMTQARIKAWYEHWDGQVYVSISGGKDSQVLAHIVKDIYPDVPLVFVNTGLEYNSVRRKGVALADEVLEPSMNFENVITKYGYPIISKDLSLKVSRIQHKKDSAYLRFFDGSNKGKSMYDHSNYKWILNAPFRISNMCCVKMKEEPLMKKKNPYIGTLAEESLLRRNGWLKSGCNAFDKKHPSSNPLSFWTEQDILQYIKQNNLKIAEVYGDIVYTDNDGMYYDNPIFNDSMKLTTTGVKRTGCVFCLFGITQDTDRLLKLKDTDSKKYDYVMRGGMFDNEGMWIPHNGLGYKFVIDWLNEHGNLNIKY